MTPTEARESAIRMAETDTDAGLDLARAIEDPWFSTQALAWIGWLAEDVRFLEIEQEALARCRSGDDPYTAVGVAAWPIAALVQRGRLEEAMHAAQEALQRSPQIEHPVRRADALFVMWQALFPLGEHAIAPVTDAVQAACLAGKGWRSGYILRMLILMLAQHSPPSAREILASMEKGKYRCQAERRLAAEEFDTPREFFWERRPA